MFHLYQLLKLLELAYAADPNQAMGELGKLLHHAEKNGHSVTASMLREAAANLADGLPLRVLGHQGQLQGVRECQ